MRVILLGTMRVKLVHYSHQPDRKDLVTLHKNDKDFFITPANSNNVLMRTKLPWLFDKDTEKYICE